MHVYSVHSYLIYRSTYPLTFCTAPSNTDGKDEIKLSKPLTQLATKQISPSHGPHLKKRGTCLSNNSMNCSVVSKRPKEFTFLHFHSLLRLPCKCQPLPQNSGEQKGSLLYGCHLERLCNQALCGLALKQARTRARPRTMLVLKQDLRCYNESLCKPPKLRSKVTECVCLHIAGEKVICGLVTDWFISGFVQFRVCQDYGFGTLCRTFTDISRIPPFPYPMIAREEKQRCSYFQSAQVR
ncbi:hypothetical protein P5673_021934 [Acropora cervicornis]|uniref:Uncharacterized protein n=1 Tax=Acropora cervicornis TaxID=6130 RepID=A0AAD9Q7Q6_ACRCE|nr:hypothetical protein P5673_021934 [Acropora cervicornis]